MHLYVALGSNLGNRSHAIMEAVAALTEIVGPLVALSSLHETEAVDMPEGTPPFLNAVALYDTTLSPAQLLYVTQAIEQAMGRTEKTTTTPDGTTIHPDRIIDIDILALGPITLDGDQLTLGTVWLDDEEVLPGQRLTLPHPRMTERQFVMQPLMELISANKI